MSSYLAFTYVLVPIFLAAALALMAAGHRVGTNRLAEDTEAVRMGLVAMESAVFGVLGLVLAFTYAGAASRFEQRRAVAVLEANALGTAWLRMDLVPEPARRQVKEEMARYAQVHVAAYRAMPDYEAYRATLARAKAMQAKVWTMTVAAVRDAPPPTARLTLPPLNELIDATASREALATVHTPGAILTMLIALALAGSFLGGYGLAGAKPVSRRLHMVGFAIVLTAVIYIVLDYDYPRMGLIRVDFADAALSEAAAAMK